MHTVVWQACPHLCDIQCAFAGVILIESHQQEHIQRNTDALRNM